MSNNTLQGRPPDSSPLDRAAISRLNGAKSRGPVTPEGKQRSSQNSARHGLLAKMTSLNNEDKAGFLELLDDYIERLQPADMVEMRLVERVALAASRLERMASAEPAIFDLEMDRQADQIAKEFSKIDQPTRFVCAFKSLADNSKSLSLFLRYHTSISREYDRAMNALSELRRKFPLPAPEPPHEIRNEPSPDPNPNKTHECPTTCNLQASAASVLQPGSECSERPQPNEPSSDPNPIKTNTQGPTANDRQTPTNDERLANGTTAHNLQASAASVLQPGSERSERP